MLLKARNLKDLISICLDLYVYLHQYFHFPHKSVMTNYSKLLAILLCATILLYSCDTSGTKTDTTTQEQDTTANDPVETKDPVTDYAPAFEGQTRIAGVKTTSAYEGTVLTRSEEHTSELQSRENLVC